MIFRIPAILLLFIQAVEAAPTLNLAIDSSGAGVDIDLRRYSLGQGGLSHKPMFDAHIEQLVQLQPQTIRIFVQEYFDLYPRHQKFHWTALDKVLESVKATGAKPILCLCFKPRILFPKIDQHIVHPDQSQDASKAPSLLPAKNYLEWEELLFRLVRHCNVERGFGVEYWEIANEPDIGEDGGCPYLFQPADYVLYYTHSARAIRRAAPAAKIGGPALAGYNSEIGRSLIEHCGNGRAPLDFFSWHIYNNDAAYFRKSIRDIKARLARFSALQNTETLIDEWNMSLEHPNLESGFQPVFILETTFGFLEEGLSRSAYYHIRDWFVDPREFAGFMSTKGVAFMARWWNEMPQYDGIYDNQCRVRPSYFAFKFLSAMRGQRLNVTGTTPDVHALAVKAPTGLQILIWNVSSDSTKTNEIELSFPPKLDGHFRVTRINSASHINELEILESGRLAYPKRPVFALEPYGIRLVSVWE